MISSEKILKALPNVLKTVDIPNLGEKHQGKVRDYYFVNDKRVLITTDRQSAFDVILGHIPFKGTVLNLLTKFWLENTSHIVPNHMISVPDPNVMVGKNCQLIPIEMVVRGYITGVTNTSIWYAYKNGERTFCGINLPDGLVKNQKLPTPIITPSTHGEPGTHDVNMSRQEILDKKIISEAIYTQMEKAALDLFAYGTKVCEGKGLILVDTKYEFGLYNGQLTLIDEIHTPDSSRFWRKDSYQTRVNNGEEPENFDKEFIRLWYSQKGYTGDGQPPEMGQDLVVAASQRYVEAYELITGNKFEAYEYPIEDRIIKALEVVKL